MKHPRLCGCLVEKDAGVLDRQESLIIFMLQKKIKSCFCVNPE